MPFLTMLAVATSSFMLPGSAPLAPVRMGASFRMAAEAAVASTAVPAAAPAGDMNVVACKTPAATFQALVDKGVANSKMSVGKTMFSSITGGCYVGIGGLLSVAICGALPGVAATNPGFIRFIFAALFPVNLLLVLQTGAQLFTGNTATLSSAYWEGKVTLKDVARSWTLSFIGNVIGCGLIALATMYTGLLSYGTADLAIATVMKKCSQGFGPTFVKAIMCNWLVCLAVYLATQAQDMAGKMVGIWFPISTFVAIGFEHSVANMFLLPLGLLAGAPIALGATLAKNLIPVTLGNAFAGAIVVGAGFSYLHGSLGKGK